MTLKSREMCVVSGGGCVTSNGNDFRRDPAVASEWRTGSPLQRTPCIFPMGNKLFSVAMPSLYKEGTAVELYFTEKRVILLTVKDVSELNNHYSLDISPAKQSRVEGSTQRDVI